MGSIQIKEVQDGYLLTMPYCQKTMDFIDDLKPVIPYGRGRRWCPEDKVWWISRVWWGGVCHFIQSHFQVDRIPRIDQPVIELIAEQIDLEPLERKDKQPCD